MIENMIKRIEKKYSNYQIGETAKSQIKDIIRLEMEYITSQLDEAITIPIEIGDTVLGGKFKNKPIVVKSIDKNEKGDITINGKPLLKFRLKERIEKVGEKWVVYPSKGGNRLGTHDTKEKALAQLKAIEASKVSSESVNELSDSAKYYRDNPEARKKKAETDKKINKRPEQVQKRVESNKKRSDAKKRGQDVNGKDYDHATNRFEKTATNRGRAGEGGRKKTNEELLSEIPMADLKQIDHFADKHFFDRLNNPRNENVAPNHNGKSAPYGSGYDEMDEANAISGGKVHKLITGKNITFKGKKYPDIEFEVLGIDNNSQIVKLKVLAPKNLFGEELNVPFKTIRRGPFLKTDTSKQFEGTLNEIPMADLKQIDHFADKKMSPDDIVITDKHFFDRLNDPRNGKDISQAELVGFFKRLSKHKDEFIEFLKKYNSVITTDKRTDINIPFMRRANKQIVAKTIMRTKNFKSSDKRLEF